ncbi:MAG: hypothetical protein ABEK50_01405 [bacterium]
MAILVVSLPSALVAAETESLKTLTVNQLTRLRTEVLPELKTNSRGIEGRNFSQYQTALETLGDTLKKDEGNRERLLEGLEAAAKTFRAIDSLSLTFTEGQLDRLEDFVEDSMDNPEEYSSTGLLNEWSGIIGPVDEVGVRLKYNKQVLELPGLYLAYTLRTDPDYRSELLIRYMDKVFPAAVSGFLRSGSSLSGSVAIYRGILKLAHDELEASEGDNLTRSYTSKLRYHGRILKEIAANRSGSGGLSATLSDIERIGRELTGSSRSQYDFLQ